MKYIKNKFTMSALLLLVMLTVDSCKKGYFYPGINSDPRQLANPTPTLLLPTVIAYTSYEWFGDASRFASIFTNQTTGTGNQTHLYAVYEVTPSDVDNLWTFGLYGKIMTNANQLISIAAASGEQHYEALGKILMANALGQATDYWGDVPYSEAFKGALNISPKYDAQKDIYADIDGLLSDAITELGASETTAQPGADDLLYGGDLTKWKAYAYSLKAKFYLHLGKIDAGNYAKALTAAASGFESADQDAIFAAFSGPSSTTQSPWFQENDQRAGDFTFTGYVYDLMAAAKDPRESAAAFGDGKGTLGALYGSQGSPVPLMTYDELQFVKAEAAFQSGDKASAATAYNAAVTANLNRTVGSTAYATTVAKTAATITLNDIMTQKYIGEFLSPEVWTDWRRTGLPALTPNPNGTLGGQIPRSFLYPISEVNLNKNTPANTSMTRRVYWDVAASN